MRVVSSIFGFAMLASSHLVIACSLRASPPTVAISSNLVAFVGVVEDYSMMFGLLKDQDVAPGLRLRVTEATLSSRVGDIVEVYPLEGPGDCSSRPYEANEVRARYHLGTTMAVVAYSSTAANGKPDVLHVPWQSRDGGIAPVPPTYLRTANGTFDFAKAIKHDRDTRDMRGPASTDPEYWLRVHAASQFAGYQYFKSLAFLRSSQDDAARLAELENIRYYQGFMCMLDLRMRKAYDDLVRSTGLPQPMQDRALAGLPVIPLATQSPSNSKTDFAFPDMPIKPLSLRGTVFEGYCDVQ